MVHKALKAVFDNLHVFESATAVRLNSEYICDYTVHCADTIIMDQVL